MSRARALPSVFAATLAALTACEHDENDATSSGTGAAMSSSTVTTSTTIASTTSSSDASSSSGAGAGGATSSSTDASSSSSGMACNTVATVFPIEPAPHTMANCDPVVWNTNPPTSGPHFPNWAAYTTYATPVTRGFWVHAMEHGAVVVLYNCPNGCDADVALLESFVASRPVDPLCVAPLQRRVILTPDPLLPTKFALTAWGASVTSECVDIPAFDAFYAAHYATGMIENTCADGIAAPFCP